MSFRNIKFGPKVLLMRFYQLLGRIWFVPFGFYKTPILTSGTVPHPLKPRGFRDLILNKMMFPDNIMRAVFADKIATRGYVANIIGPQYNVEIYDICNTIKDLSKKEYPYPYVVKPNHASGQFAFIHNDADRIKMLKNVRKWDSSEYKPKTEWAYRGIRHKFLVEKLVQSQDGTGPTELCIYYFFGEPALLYLIKGRDSTPHKVFLTPDWQSLDLILNQPILKNVPSKPIHLDKIMQLGNKLVGDLDLLRVDFLLVDDDFYVGELTNFSGGGNYQFKPIEYDAELLAQYNRIRQKRIDAAREKYHGDVLNKLRHRIGNR